MKSIISVLQDFEKLVYKILMWVILIPKTIVYITIDPIDAPNYIEQELTQDKDSPFDEHMSPVILLLVVAFLPALAFNFLPKYGATITKPAEEDVITGRYVQFQAQTDFKGGSNRDSKYLYVWEVEKIADNGAVRDVYSERHREDEPGVFLTKVDRDTISDQFVYNFTEPGDYYVNVSVARVDAARDDATIEEYTSSALVKIPPLESGQVTVSTTDGKTTKAGAPETGNFSERLKQEETIFLALALMIPPLLFAFASRFLLDKTKLQKAPAKEAEPANALKIKATVEIAGEKLSKDLTIPLSAAPPDDVKPSEEVPSLAKKQVEYVSIGEDTLKQSFYVQCYYFSPLSLAVWGTIYAAYFFTQDIFLYRSTGLYWQIILAPLVLCVMWFFRTEVKHFVIERKIAVHWAVTIVLACVALIALGANAIFSFEELKDLFRVWMIRLFPVASLGLFGAFFYSWYWRRQKHKEPVVSSNGAGVLAVLALFLVVMISIPAVVRRATPSAVAVGVEVERTSVSFDGPVAIEATNTTVVRAATMTPVLAQPTASPVLALASPTIALDQSLLTAILGQATFTPLPPPATPTLIPATPTSIPSAFYVEEFNSDLTSWFNFLTSGDKRMVRQSLDQGKLVIELLQVDDILPWYYLINEAYAYTDVKVETVMINLGNNTNGVSLVCRYSDIGWYEFVVSNSGFYYIYAVDNAGILNQGYNLLAEGASSAIKNTDDAVNTYTAICQGDKLELLVNGQSLRTVNERNFKFSEGWIGMAVSSPAKLPVWVEFESLTVSEP